jgi:hypothetical protein
MAEGSDLLSALKQTLKDPNAPEAETGPRRSPHVEAMIAVLLEARAGNATPEQALAAIETMQQRLAAAQQDLENSVQNANLSATQEALVERIREGYRENGVILNAMHATAAASDYASLDQHVDELRRLTGQLYACYDTWQVEAREATQTGDGMAMVPVSYGKLYEACDQVARGNVAVSVWLESLNAVETEIRNIARRLHDGIGSLSDKLAKDTYCSALAGEILAGYDDSIEALGIMRQFESDRNVAHLNQGWTHLVGGHLRSQKALRSLQAGAGGTSDMVILDTDE